MGFRLSLFWEPTLLLSVLLFNFADCSSLFIAHKASPLFVKIAQG
jgi:hypothetical protein